MLNPNLIYEGYEEIKDALDALASDNDQVCTMRLEATGLRRKMDKLEIIFLTILWIDLLERIHKTSSVLQTRNIDLYIATGQGPSTINDGTEQIESTFNHVY